MKQLTPYNPSQPHELIQQSTPQQILQTQNIPFQDKINDKSQKINQQKQHSAYRPDIDGLRTVAVTSVILFHAWPLLLKGGFLGVDVFFVISGYLISGLIIKAQIQGKFTFADFYSRRIKRIYPALIVVLIFVLTFGCIKLLERSLYILSRTMAASSIFLANIEILTYKTTYFDPSTKQNPLLHLWSLAVEEQFYIFWPLFLTIIVKFFRKYALYCISLFTLFSFVFGIVWVYISPKFAFYFPVCRFWQMAIGGLLAYKKLKLQKKNISNALSIIGIFLILISICIVSQENAIPGWWALLPTFGAIFIIAGGQDAVINKKILSSRGFVFIGKISYPLYLWHWPLMVFSRLLYPPGSRSIFGNIFFIIIVSILFSILTYYFIQNSIRFRQSKITVIALFSIIIIIGVIAYIIQQNPLQFSLKSKKQQQLSKIYFKQDMLPTIQDFYQKNGKNHPNSSKNKNRTFPSVEKLFISKKYDYNITFFQQVTPKSIFYKQNRPFLNYYQVANQGKKNLIFVIGDSHAGFTSLRLWQLYLQNKQKNALDKFPTMLLMIRQGQPFAPCSSIYNYSISAIKQYKPNKIIFKNAWALYLQYGDESGSLHKSDKCYHGGTFVTRIQHQSLKDVLEDIEIYSNTMKQLVNLGFQVFVVKFQLTDSRLGVNKLMDEDGVISQNLEPFKLSQFRNRYKFTLDVFQNSLKNAGVKFIDYADNYCWQDMCYPIIPSGYSVYRDYHHFSNLYAKYWLSSVDFLTQFIQ